MSTPRIKTRYAGVYCKPRKKTCGRGTDCTFYVIYRCGGRAGRQVEEAVGRKSEGMTAAKANLIRGLRACGNQAGNGAVRARARQGAMPADGSMNIGTLWRIYEANHRHKASTSSDRAYIKHLVPLLARKAHTLTTADVDHLSRRLFATPIQRPKAGGEARTLSAQSVKHVLGLLQRMLRYADEMDICPYPAGLKFRMPRLDNEKTESMTAEQRQRYLAALDEEQNQDEAAILRLALMTGIRKGALLALQWQDLDFEHGFIILRGRSAKKGRTERIPMTPLVREILENVGRHGSPYVFPARDGGRRRDFRAMANRVKKKAGLPDDFRPMHGLRHSYASFMASSGVSLYVLQKLLTHESPEMTKRYAHLADAALQQAARVADGMVG